MPEITRKNELLLRLYIVMLLFVLAAGVIAWRIVDIAVINGEYWRQKKESRYMEWRKLPTQRGNIYADDGHTVLATSVEFFDIRMDPVAPVEKVFNANIRGLCQKLSVFPGGKTPQEWFDYIVAARRDKKRYILITRKVDHDGLKRLKSYPLFEKGSTRGGLIKVARYVRNKPFQEMASRTIGVDREKNKVGLEASYDSHLKGKEKKVMMHVLPERVYIPAYDPTEFEILKGGDIVSNINTDLQDVVHHELKKGIERHQAEAGVAIVMEVSTGRIKAISNLSRNSTGHLGEYLNMALMRRSEPGSTIKSASVLALLEDGLAQSETTVAFEKGEKMFYDLTMKDSYHHDQMYGSLREAFEKSSNIGVANALNTAYHQTSKASRYYQKLMQFGFDAPTSVDMQGEVGPYVKNPVKDRGKWYGTTIPWMAIGYELSMTPLQLLNFYNAVANNGKLMKPQFVKKIIEADGQVKERKPVVLKESIASEESIKTLQSMLEGVVLRGTGKNLNTSDYRFAGKTGTTQVGYDKEEIEYNASFAGYWPAEKPQYSMIVVMYGLKGKQYYGNIVAGPVFKKIMDLSYSMNMVQSVRSYAVEDTKAGTYDGQIYGNGQDFADIFHNVDVPFNQAGRWIKGNNLESGKVISSKAKITTDVVPDLSGMGVRDAVYVLENLGMSVKLEGVGQVEKQSIRPGSNIDNQFITLYLN